MLIDGRLVSYADAILLRRHIQMRNKGKLDKLARLAIIAAIIAVCGAAHADDLLADLDIDARRAVTAEINAANASALSDPATGFTDVVPPAGVRQRWSSRLEDDGVRTFAEGVELSVWQTIPLPEDGRWLLKWHFDYEGEITKGRGRAGFIFGNPERADLLSVELTYHGELRLVSWGRPPHGTLGRIVWAKRAAAQGSRPFRIEADYDMRAGTLSCSVDGAAPIVIDLSSVMPSGPMTIRGAGYFTAVQEARRISRIRDFDSEADIVMSQQYVEALHRRLRVEGTR